ncbi:uncharacterized protein [Littorina saxatilis]|uniref:uncharacterized protein n=1 Tax=Littorina saxatilis TaxID=31220 RepID=UPI0038B5966B
MRGFSQTLRLSDSGTSAVAMAAGDKGGGREWNADTLLPKVTQQLRTLYPWCEDMPLRFETLAKQQTKLMLQELYADIPGNTGLCDSHPTSDVPLDFGPSPGVQTHDPATHHVKACDPATLNVKARGFKDAASPTSTISKMQPPQCQNNSSGLQPSTPDTRYQSHVTFQCANRAFQGVDEFPFECWDPWGVPPKPPPGMTSGMTSALVEEPVLPNDSCCSKVRKLCLDKANVKSVRPPLKPPLATQILPTKQQRSPITDSATSVTSAKPSSSRQDCQPSSVAMTTGVMTNTQRLRPSCGNKKPFVLENCQPVGRPKTNKPSFPVKSDSVGRHDQQGQVTDKEKRLKRQDIRRTDDNVPYPVLVEDWEDEIEQFPAGFMGNYQPHKLKLFQSRDKGEENLGESKLKGIPGLVVNAPQKQAPGRSRKSLRAEEQPEGKTQMENAATKDRCLQDGSNVPHEQQWVKIGKQGKEKKKAQRKEKV